MAWVLGGNGTFQWKQPEQTGGSGGIIDVGGLTDAMTKAHDAWITANPSPSEQAANPFPIDMYTTQINTALAQNKQTQDALDSANALQFKKDELAQQTATSAANRQASAAAAAQARADKIAADAKTAREKIVTDTRMRQAGNEAATYLETSAADRKKTADAQIASLYSGLGASQKKQFEDILNQLNIDVTAAGKTIQTASDKYTSSFKPSASFQNVPIATFGVGDNPLISALQQQGAGTGQVTAATEQANKTASATSALEQWAMNQLNTNAQNFDTATLNAGKEALAASLSGLASRAVDIKAGMSAEQQKQADALAREKAGAQQTSDAEIQKLIDEAAKTRAATTASYGEEPKTTTDASGKVIVPAATRLEQVAMAPTQFANFKAAVTALNPDFAGTTAEAKKKFPNLAAAFGKK